MKQYIYLLWGLFFLFTSAARVAAQEFSDYSQLNDEDYSKINLPPLVRSVRECQKQPYL